MQKNEVRPCGAVEVMMLELRNLCKTYRSKSGVEVHALDDVSLVFPARGMVFLLGKSGSGKSTLLNVAGGLDTYDSGELVICGKSSGDFRRSDFDSYRNTYIGFIFQEYNILDDFSVGANIGLALELQGKRATEEEINRMLTEVDLAGFGNRKPNELSGGQKQRIAIARALIKDPQIIMADEPTGALDSVTGKQVLETLKKLSRDKLVIVVSHDREFAETYADRIIELADGKVISDTTLTDEAVRIDEKPELGMNILSETEIAIDAGYTLTDADLASIKAYLASHENDVTIHRMKPGESAKMSKKRRIATPTTQVEIESYTAEDAKFIRSRLPMRKATKMGLSSIKSKPIRLLFTILLSLVAFSLFGFADVAIAYNQTSAMNSTIRDMDADALVMMLFLRETNITYDRDGKPASDPSVYYHSNDAINDEDVKALEAQTGLNFFPIYNTGNNAFTTVSVGQFVSDSSKLENGYGESIFQKQSTGITEVTVEDLNSLGFALTRGVMPAAPGEILITEYYYKMFELGGFVAANGEKKSTVLGETMYMSMGEGSAELKVVGVVDTGFQYDRYPSLKWDLVNDGSYRTDDVYEVREQLEMDVASSFHTLLFAFPGTIDTLPPVSGHRYVSWGENFSTSYLQIGYKYHPDALKEEFVFGAGPGTMVGDKMMGQFSIVWYDGVERTALGENDFVISAEDFVTCLSYETTKMWEGSPVPELATLAGGNTILFYEHWTRESDDGGEMRYHYAKLLGMSDAAYEARLTTCFNEYYDLQFTTAEYKAAASWQAGALQVSTSMGQDDIFALYMLRRIYDDLRDPTFMTRVTTDQEFFNYLVSQGNALESDGTVGGYLDRMVSENPQIAPEAKRAFLADQAALYLRYNIWDTTAARFGYNILALKSQAFAEAFLDMSEKERTIIVRLLSNDSGDYVDVERVVTGVYTVQGKSNQESCVISNYYYNLAVEERKKQDGGYYTETIIAPHITGKYGSVMCAKPTDDAAIRVLTDNHLDEENGCVYRLQSEVIDLLDNVNEMIVILDKVFLGVGIFFALFAALMMFNFISASITNKKREIGILRAVGARSRDVFLIFFTEAFFVAVVNFVLSAVVSFVGITAVNLIIRNGLEFDMTLFSFGIRQIIVLFVVSMVVALVSSFIPTNSIARKTPVDAMRDR